MRFFKTQDDLVPGTTSTVADAYGVLPHTMSQAVRSKDPSQLAPYEALLRSFSYAERVAAASTPKPRPHSKKPFVRPGSSDCWAMLSILLADEHIHGFSGPPDPLSRAVQAARQCGVDTGPGNHKAHQALDLFFRKEIPASRIAAERTLALNPMDASAAVYVGPLPSAASGSVAVTSSLKPSISIQITPDGIGSLLFSMLIARTTTAPL